MIGCANIKIPIAAPTSGKYARIFDFRRKFDASIDEGKASQSTLETQNRRTRTKKGLKRNYFEIKEKINEKKTNPLNSA